MYIYFLITLYPMPTKKEKRKESKNSNLGWVGPFKKGAPHRALVYILSHRAGGTLKRYIYRLVFGVRGPKPPHVFF